MIEKIDTFKLFVIFFSSQGFIIVALMAIGQFIRDRKSPKTILFIGLFLVFALFEIHILLFETNLFHGYTSLHHLSIPAYYLMSPLLFFLTRFTLDKNFSFNKMHLLHFTPTFISIIATIYSLLIIPKGNTPLLNNYFYNNPIMILTIIGYLIFTFYLMVIFVIINESSLWTFNTLQKEPSVLIILVLFSILFIGWITDCVAVLLNNTLYIEITIILITIIIIFLFLINFKYPDFFIYTQNLVVNQQKKRSYLIHIDFTLLKKKLNQAMTIDQIYLDENISLLKLAHYLDVSSHQLSQFINEEYQINFNVFINNYRIEKAKELLLSKKEENILSIAYEVGFKSKSSFNALFQKTLGMSPTQFRDKNQK